MVCWSVLIFPNLQIFQPIFENLYTLNEWKSSICENKSVQKRSSFEEQTQKKGQNYNIFWG